MSIFVSILYSVLYLSSTYTIAASNHAGHSSGASKGSSGYCKKAAVGHLKPKHLESVAPESPFSFWVYAIDDAEQVEVTVKKIAVEVEAQQRTGVMTFKGHLPKELVGTVARIRVKVNGKKCSSEKGWLIKITE